MKVYKVGEKSKAICESCGQLRSTTFLERTVPLSSGKGSVANILIGVCTETLTDSAAFSGASEPA